MIDDNAFDDLTPEEIQVLQLAEEESAKKFAEEEILRLKLEEDFRREQAALEQEIRDNLDKPIGQYHTGVWVRLTQEEIDEWYARQAEHERTKVPNAQAAATLRINGQAQTIRDAKITPTEVPVYDRKEFEANRLLVDKVDPAKLPLLAGEAKRTGKTPNQIATVWQTKATERWALTSQIDQLRMDTNDAVAKATTGEEIDTLVEGYRKALQGL